MGAAVVANEDADYSNDLLALTRTLKVNATGQAEWNLEIYKMLMQYK